MLSRVGRADSPLAPASCDLVVEAVLSALGPTIDDVGGIVTVDPLPVVLGESHQLSLVFQNLIANALKFVTPGQSPRVWVRAERVGAHWCFTITDNGIGIAPRHRERVFGMFKRLNGRDDYPGTGIGLALVKKIIEQRGGHIGVDDNPAGSGCQFWFTLPSAGGMSPTLIAALPNTDLIRALGARSKYSW
jgi:signal transduction histidine kinase